MRLLGTLREVLHTLGRVLDTPARCRDARRGHAYVDSLAATEQGENSSSFCDLSPEKWLKLRQESGLDCLMCAEFTRGWVWLISIDNFLAGRPKQSTLVAHAENEGVPRS